VKCPHCATTIADDSRFCGTCGRATSMTEPLSQGGVLRSLVEQDTLVGREIAGRYRLLAKLGEGGMGAVYRAEQMSLKRTVAVKVLRPDVANSPLLLRRFNAEAEAVAKLNHPNTVGIYDYGQDADGTTFIAMEYIEGSSLRKVVHTEAPLRLQRVLRIAAQICASLTDAHARSIVHRDLKPDNVMLQTRGREHDVVRVLDFGIAKLRDDDRATKMQMTQQGDMLGTPQYMAPEQIRGEHVDGRADIYALGCMLYEMATGRLAFEAQNVMAMLSKHLIETPPPPSARRPDLAIPPAFDALVADCMSKAPAQRPANMEVLTDRIAAIAQTLPVDTAVATAQTAPAQPYAPAFPSVPVVPTPYAGSPPANHPAYSTPQNRVSDSQAPYAGLAPGAPYDPRPPASPGPAARPPTDHSRIWLYSLIGLILVTGGGAAIYLASRSPAAPIVATQSDAGPTTDHWDVPSASPQAPVIPPGYTVTVDNVSLQLPAGFSITDSTPQLFVAVNRMGVKIILAHIEDTNDDVDQLATAYANTNNVVLVSSSMENVGGQLHKVFAFRGGTGGNVFGQAAVALMGPGYRVAMVMHIPATALYKDKNLVNVGNLLFQTVHTP
jgi:serine/threonine-protein kinase